MSGILLAAGSGFKPASGFTADILTENFETAIVGYENVWSPQGDVNAVYTSTVLQGTQSCFLDGNANYSAIDISFTAKSTIYGYFKFRHHPSAPNMEEFFSFRDVSDNTLCRFFIRNDHKINMDCGSVFAASESVGTMAVDTTYHVWVSYIKGTGSNAVGTIGWSTSGTRPTSGDNFLNVTNGDATTNCTTIRALGYVDTGWSVIFDRILLNTTQIGDSP